ncbi:hypothetical protein AAVH_34558 [Aphelenchoides avenae]|nr:hypothetical protein AAVH_34558 [Aphelenchus avenae]
MMGPPPVEPNDPQVALTCLPADTRFYELEPEGCRTNPITQLRTCVCYDHDYCNRASHRARHCTEYSVAFTVVFVVMLVVRENL